MMLCLKSVGQVESTILRILPALIPVGLKVIEKYWAKDLLRNQALDMLLAMIQDRASVPHKELLLDLGGVSVISRQVQSLVHVFFALISANSGSSRHLGKN